MSPSSMFQSTVAFFSSRFVHCSVSLARVLVEVDVEVLVEVDVEVLVEVDVEVLVEVDVEVLVVLDE